MIRAGPQSVLAVASIAMVSPAIPAHAQTGGWTIEVDGVVSPSSPSVTVNLYAWFDYEPGVAEIFQGAVTGLRAGEAGWFDLQCQLHPHCGMNARVMGGSIEHMQFGQLWIPKLGIKPDPSNPILLVVADWKTTDFTPREIVVESFMTEYFAVFGAPGVVNVVDPVIHGSAVIRVVPAPGTVAALVLGGAAFGRRRRR